MSLAGAYELLASINKKSFYNAKGRFKTHYMRKATKAEKAVKTTV